MDPATVVVTGGTGRVGTATVRALVDEGSRVVTCARDAQGLTALADDVEGPGSLTTQRADVRDEYDVERLMETAAREGDGIDAVVANAAVSHGDPGKTPIDDASYTVFDDHLRTNARGVFATFREAVPHLTDGARMVALTCAGTSDARSGMGWFAVSKATAEAVARQFAIDCPVPVGVVDPSDTGADGDASHGGDPACAADLVLWALTEADVQTLDGAVVDQAIMRDA